MVMDGYSREAVVCSCDTNKRAKTLLNAFVASPIVQARGVPHRARCDEGGENIAVCLFLEMLSCIVKSGKSVHNQRVERAWGDLFKTLISFYKALFEEMITRLMLCTCVNMLIIMWINMLINM